ncbi:MAG: CRISPR-associated endonuclease Cas2 [Sulfuricella sp.]
MLTLICYDIADDRRRNKVARLLEGWGERVQESVFECHITAIQQRRIIRDIAALIDAEQDKVRYYALCGKDRGKLQVLGKGRITQDIAYWLC